MDDYLRSLNFIKWATGAAPKILFLGDRCVPKAAVSLGILNVSFGGKSLLSICRKTAF